MADQKISKLTALSAIPAEDDYLVILDTDAGSTKKIKAEYLLGKQTSWTPTPTGWNSILGVFWYVVIGSICIARVTITAGTSTTTAAAITLPVTSANVPNQKWDGACGRCADNSAVLTTPCRWEVDANSSTVNFYSDMGTGTWTASGTKLIRATIIYEV